MKKYIVIVEYYNFLEVSEKLYDLICSLGTTEQISEHAFLLYTDKTTIFIRDVIKNSPYNINRIFVASVALPAAWRNIMTSSVELKELFHE